MKVNYRLEETTTVYRAADVPVASWYVVADMPDGQPHQVTPYMRDHLEAQMVLAAIRDGDLTRTFVEHRNRIADLTAR